MEVLHIIQFRDQIKVTFSLNSRIRKLHVLEVAGGGRRCLSLLLKIARMVKYVISRLNLYIKVLDNAHKSFYSTKSTAETCIVI
jgi:hypothetical protein